MLAATDEYFEAEDALGRWIEECCERGRQHSEATGALYASWKAWAEASGEFTGSIKRFSENLTTRGFKRDYENNTRCFRGLRLLRPATPTDPMQF